MANVDVVNLTWDMINEKEGMIVYERTKFPKLAKPLLIDRLIVILEKYRGKGIGNYVFPVYTEKHVTDKQKMGRRNSFSTLVSETLDKVCDILVDILDGFFHQLLTGAHGFQMTAFAAPDIQGRTPIAASGNRPVV